MRDPLYLPTESFQNVAAGKQTALLQAYNRRTLEEGELEILDLTRNDSPRVRVQVTASHVLEIGHMTDAMLARACTSRVRLYQAGTKLSDTDKVVLFDIVLK